MELAKSRTISVCICTYKRPQLLGRTLEEIGKQVTGGLFTYSIVVCDNDYQQSARLVVSEFCTRLSIDDAVYCVEPEQNIALARNRALENAKGDYVAFIDDDELPATDWLATLLSACEKYGVDGALGPVKPWFDQPPPDWIVRGKFCVRPEHATGHLLHWRQTRTGNAMFRRKILHDISTPFRPEFGNGGEDQDFFRRTIETGHRFVWCNEAVVYEVVPPERWKRSYMFRRALLRGQNERLFLTPVSIAKSGIAVPLYIAILPFLLIRHHLFMAYSIRLLDHVGRLFAAMGLRPLGNRYLS